MALYGTHDLEVPDGPDRASAPQAFKDYTDTLDPILDQVKETADDASGSVGDLAHELGVQDTRMDGIDTTIEVVRDDFEAADVVINNKIATLAKTGVVLAVRLAADFAITADAQWKAVPFGQVDYVNSSAGSYTAATGKWTATVAGRVKVSAAAEVCFGNTASAYDAFGSQSAVAIFRSGTTSRLTMGNLIVEHKAFVHSGVVTFNVTAGQEVTLQVYMAEAGKHKTVRGDTTGNATYMLIEYTQNAQF